MLTDLEVCDYLQNQYDSVPDVFNYGGEIADIDWWNIKLFPDCTLVAIEGTKNIPGWISDVQFVMCHVDGLGGVEEGFYSGLPKMLQTVLPLIQPHKPIIVAGHSRGAAQGHIFARMLINAGYAPERVLRVFFGSPRPGDSTFASGLAGSPCSSYWNYFNFFKKDIVPTVPGYIPFLLPYRHPETFKIISIDAPADDEWGPLKYHHIQLYRQGLINGTFSHT